MKHFFLENIFDKQMGPDPMVWGESEDTWVPYSQDVLENKVLQVEQMLLEAGLKAGSRVVICAPTSLEWDILQIAALFCNGTVLGLDPRLPTASQVEQIGDFDADWIFHTQSGWIEHFQTLFPEKCFWKIRLGDNQQPFQKIGSLQPMKLKRGHVHDKAFATYSSGTTGKPKLRLFSQQQVIQALEAIDNQLDCLNPLSKTISYLPMAHLFQRMTNLTMMKKKVPIAYCAHPDRLLGAMQKFQPDFMVMVPLVLSNLYRQISEQCPKKSFQEIFGPNLRYILSGAAPLPMEMMEHLMEFGVEVLEAYGISENIIPIAMNSLRFHRMGSVGKPLPTHVLRINDQGEIEVKSEGLFATTFDQYGYSEYWATGDLGWQDEDGYLYLKGRLGSYLKLSNGLKVYPEQIEQKLMRSMNIEHCMVLCQDQVGALIVPSPSLRTQTATEQRAQIQLQVDRVNEQLAGYEKIRNFALLPEPFNIEKEELTISLKLRRHVIMRNYAALIDQLFERAA